MTDQSDVLDLLTGAIYSLTSEKGYALQQRTRQLLLRRQKGRFKVGWNLSVNFR